MKSYLLPLAVALAMLAGLAWWLVRPEGTGVDGRPRDAARAPGDGRAASDPHTARAADAARRDAEQAARSAPADAASALRPAAVAAPAGAARPHLAAAVDAGLPTGPATADAPADAPVLAGEGEPPEGEPEAVRFIPDRDGIRAAVADRHDEIKECYEAWLRTGAHLEGKVQLRFTITPPDPAAGQGTGAAGTAPGLAVVRDAGLIHSELDHPVMEGCMINALSSLQFEAPEAELVVNYPFTFTAKPEPPEPGTPAPLPPEPVPSAPGTPAPGTPTPELP